MQAIRPQEVNESATVTSDVYTDNAVATETPLTGVEADQSSIIQRYETFPVDEELTTPPDTDLEKEKRGERRGRQVYGGRGKDPDVPSEPLKVKRILKEQYHRQKRQRMMKMHLQRIKM